MLEEPSQYSININSFASRNPWIEWAELNHRLQKLGICQHDNIKLQHNLFVLRISSWSPLKNYWNIFHLPSNSFSSFFCKNPFEGLVKSQIEFIRSCTSDKDIVYESVEILQENEQTIFNNFSIYSSAISLLVLLLQNYPDTKLRINIKIETFLKNEISVQSKGKSLFYLCFDFLAPLVHSSPKWYILWIL